MRIFKGLIAACAVCTVFGSAAAYAQTTPRIIMRRPLQPADPVVSIPQSCGLDGQPACPTDCDYVGAAWDVGRWSGDSCGTPNGTVTRTVQCVAIARSGQRVPKPDAFCLQDASAFASTCGNGSIG